jgi:hypothetical protein
MLAGCGIINSLPPTPALPVKSLTPAPVATPTASTSAVTRTPAPIQEASKEYKNNSFGICLRYPANWLGPEVYDHKDGFVFEVGTDKVYPYGTSLEKRVYTKADAYYIMITFTRRPSDISIEKYKADQPWLSQYLSLVPLKDGESKSDQRAKFTRVRSVAAADYSGVEVVATTAASAQTEFFISARCFYQFPTTRFVFQQVRRMYDDECATRRDEYCGWTRQICCVPQIS